MEKKTIVARVEVLPGKEQAFLQAADALIKGTRQKRGILVITYIKTRHNP